MKAVHLQKFGKPEKAFALVDIDKPKCPKEGVLVKVEGFGLNFADIMARTGLYPDCPPLPAVLGYDVVGVIEEVGQGVKHLKVGQRVTALTRFGGYAEYAVCDPRAVAVIDDMPIGKAMALTTQYSTAWQCFYNSVRIEQGDKVLIHAAMGGVGSALVQMALHEGAEIYATAGSDEKIQALENLGVHHAINYRKEDFFEVIKKKGVRLDVVFDSIGGSSVKKGCKLLGAGGSMVLYGAAQFNGANLFKKISTFLQFGFYHPINFMSKSQSMIGVNMLRLADYKAEKIQDCLKGVVKGVQEGWLDPTVGGVYPIEDLAKAHNDLGQRKTTGKVTVIW